VQLQWLGVRCQSEGRINGECQDQKFENASPDVSDVFHFETALHKGLVISVTRRMFKFVLHFVMSVMLL